MQIDDDTLRKLLVMAGVDPYAPAVEPAVEPAPVAPEQTKADFRNASPDEFRAELARYNLRPKGSR